MKALKNKRFVCIMVSCLTWGIIAHGMALFNKISYHDDVMWPTEFWDDQTFALGRWGLGVLGSFFRLVFGSDHYSTSTFHGFVTIVCIAFILNIVASRLRIKNRISLVVLSGVMVCFPAITCAFGFMYLAPYYYLGAAGAVYGAYIYYNDKTVKNLIICATLMAFSTSLYQSNISIHLIVLLLFMIDEILISDTKWKSFFTLILNNILICAVFMTEYFALNSLFLKIRNVELSDYKDISSYGGTSLPGYFARVFSAYKRFVKPADYIGNQGVSANMFPWSLKYFHMFLIVITLVMIIVYLISLKNKRKIVQAGILLAVSPLLAYFIYVMVGEPEVHGLMTYSEVFLFFIPVYFAERETECEKLKCNLKRIMLTVMAIMCIAFARFSNVCYLKAYIMQTEAISYYTSLSTRIQSAEGYTSDMPVLYLGENKKNEDGFFRDDRFEPIYLPPYNGKSVINDYGWRETMAMWCGFSPVEATGEDYKSLDSATVSQMPEYPSEGSVRVIDNVLVVKFSE